MYTTWHLPPIFTTARLHHPPLVFDNPLCPWHPQSVFTTTISNGSSNTTTVIAPLALGSHNDNSTQRRPV